MCIRALVAGFTQRALAMVRQAARLNLLADTAMGPSLLTDKQYAHQIT